ncbi:MAG: hypothetical protein ABII01_07185 [Candidatus Woesearchaeota archaeon]
MELINQDNNMISKKEAIIFGIILLIALIIALAYIFIINHSIFFHDYTLHYFHSGL